VDTPYRPHLDGLRAVAVLLVVAYHARLGKVTGGFIGVDIFFVLSGFLVTRILLRDLTSGGRIRWRQFYARRVRRILPAALVTLVITALVYAAIATPAEMFDALGGFRAAFFYVANWHFIRQSTDYFATDVNTNPVLHFWSLAVEEQFYLLWPLFLGGLYVLTARAGRGRWWVLRGLVVALALVSAIEALHIGATNLDRAYYGTDTRAYELLAGAALALTPQLLELGGRFRRAAPWSAAVTLFGLFVLASSAFEMSPITRGMSVTVLAVMLIVSLENAHAATTKRYLSASPMTYLGRISYGIYLWHWPVIVLLTHDRNVSPVRLFAITRLVACALAASSFHLLEHPLRTSRLLDRYRTPVVVIGFVSSILVGALVMPQLLDRGDSVVAATGGSSSGSLLDWRVAKRDMPDLPDCLNRPLIRCTVVPAGAGAKRAVLMGDSVAKMWIPAFTKIAKRAGFSLSIAAYPGCPWQRDLQYAGSPKVTTECRKHQRDWYERVVPELRPDIVFVAQHGYDDPKSPNRFLLPGGHASTIRSDGFEQMLADVTASSLTQLRARGREIVLVEPVPSPPTFVDPLSCLSAGRSVASCGFDVSTVPTPFKRYFRAIAATDSAVKRVDVDRLVCPREPRCDAVLHDIIVWHDSAHLTATYARSLAGPMLAILRAQHII
jgi:peptidoglycan/LPS O-acetylase OafA/YrhL